MDGVDVVLYTFIKIRKGYRQKKKENFIYLEEIEKLIVYIYVTLQLYTGIRPKDIKFIRLYEHKNDDIQNRDLLLDIYKYYHFLDGDDESSVLKQLDLMEKSKERYFLIMGENLAYELFYVSCVFKNDIEKAEELYSNISKTINNAYIMTSCRIKMAYELYVKKDNEKALHIGKIGLMAKEDYGIEGLAIFEFEQIKKNDEKNKSI